MAFKAWADGVKGASGDALAGEEAVVANAHAAAAYLLGAERLFENEPLAEVVEMTVAERSSGTLAPLMGTIVKGQSRAILPLRFPRYLGSSVHRRLSADAIRLQKVSSVFLLFAIRSLRRACIVWSVFRGAIYRAHFHAGARAHSPGTGHRDFVKPGARANERAQLRLARNPLDWLRCRLLLP